VIDVDETDYVVRKGGSEAVPNSGTGRAWASGVAAAHPWISLIEVVLMQNC
jgi:hypothetical protein